MRGDGGPVKRFSSAALTGKPMSNTLKDMLWQVKRKLVLETRLLPSKLRAHRSSLICPIFR